MHLIPSIPVPQHTTLSGVYVGRKQTDIACTTGQHAHAEARFPTQVVSRRNTGINTFHKVYAVH